MSDYRYPNHDWRADSFTLIRGEYAADINRAWCADNNCTNPWRWVVHHVNTGDCRSLVPDDVKQDGFTFAEAVAAAERFLEEREREEAYTRHARFDGVPSAAETECF